MLYGAYTFSDHSAIVKLIKVNTNLGSIHRYTSRQLYIIIIVYNMPFFVQE